ncbi:hypothetical protein KWW24_18610, partial [Clostridioides difficile]|nr:hypothetical protein [Clostridioides difficile]
MKKTNTTLSEITAEAEFTKNKIIEKRNDLKAILASKNLDVGSKNTFTDLINEIEKLGAMPPVYGISVNEDYPEDVTTEQKEQAVTYTKASVGL